MEQSSAVGGHPSGMSARLKELSGWGRASLALGLAAAVLVAVWWMDTLALPLPMVGGYLNELTYHEPLWAIACLATAGGALLLARLVWWSRSALVGATSLAVGAWLLAGLASQGWGRAEADGRLHALATLGGVVATVGLFVLALGVRDWVNAGEPDARAARQAPSARVHRRMPMVGWAVLAFVAAAASLLAVSRVDDVIGQMWFRLRFPDNSSIVSLPSGTALNLGAQLFVAILVLIVAVAAWRSRSNAVGVAYAIAGSFFAFLTVIRYVQDPGPPGSPLSILRMATDGPLNGVTMIGAAMAVVGVAIVTRSLREWAAAGDLKAPPASASESAQP